MVIIDEAHNIVDAISNVHSITITLRQLRLAMSQLTMYLQKYKSRLKGKNRVYVTQIIRLINSIMECLQMTSEKSHVIEGILETSSLLAGKGVDQINPHKLIRYLHESKLARKVEGFIDHTEKKDKNSSGNANPTTPILIRIQSFLIALMNPSAEGRMFFTKKDNEVHLRYTLLDPTAHFREIVEEARAVILAGGTMSPVGSAPPENRFSLSGMLMLHLDE